MVHPHNNLGQMRQAVVDRTKTQLIPTQWYYKLSWLPDMLNIEQTILITRLRWPVYCIFCTTTISSSSTTTSTTSIQSNRRENGKFILASVLHRAFSILRLTSISASFSVCFRMPGNVGNLEIIFNDKRLGCRGIWTQ